MSLRHDPRQLPFCKTTGLVVRGQEVLFTLPKYNVDRRKSSALKDEDVCLSFPSRLLNLLALVLSKGLHAFLGICTRRSPRLARGRGVLVGLSVCLSTTIATHANRQRAHCHSLTSHTDWYCGDPRSSQGGDVQRRGRI